MRSNSAASGLDTRLRAKNYKIPAGGAPALRAGGSDARPDVVVDEVEEEVELDEDEDQDADDAPRLRT